MAANYLHKVEASDVPIPTTRRPTQLASQATVRRAKTLTRPERSVAPVPLITPQPAGVGAVDPVTSGGFDPWKIFSRILTFWAPGILLSSLGGLNDKQKQQAWREKITLCFIIICLCGTVGFITVGLQNVFCPHSTDGTAARFISVGSTPGFVAVGGFMLNSTQSNNADVQTLATQLSGQDISNQFQRPASFYTACAGGTFHAATDDPCATATDCQLGVLNAPTFTTLGLRNTSLRAGYDWDQVARLTNYLVIDGTVLNMTPYMTAHKAALSGDNIDTALRSVLSSNPENGKDGTLVFYSRNDLKAAVPCLTQRYHAGNIDKITPGCFISQLVLYAGLIVILGLILIRFVMACVFNWCLSARLAGSVSSSLLNKSAISPSVMPEGANVSIDNVNGQAPWAGGGRKKLQKGTKSARSTGSGSTLVHSDAPAPVMSLTQIGAELFAVCLVTCYSEGEDSLRTTLDSISTTQYSDSRKLLFVVADGMITGAGEKRSTPDICVSLLDPDPRFGNPIPMSYEAVGSGAKAENRAMVYAGHYSAYPLLRSHPEAAS
jgi:chitin synthase